jgi:hypothetical protein
MVDSDNGTTSNLYPCIVFTVAKSSHKHDNWFLWRQFIAQSTQAKVELMTQAV